MLNTYFYNPTLGAQDLFLYFHFGTKQLLCQDKKNIIPMRSWHYQPTTVR